MTDSEREKERNEARVEVDAALREAERIAARGAKIAEGWRRSRADNNFRMMLRAISNRTEGHAS